MGEGHAEHSTTVYSGPQQTDSVRRPVGAPGISGWPRGVRAECTPSMFHPFAETNLNSLQLENWVD